VSDVTPAGRHAVLVDVGYLYASVGQLVLGRTSRREFRIAAEPLIRALLARATTTTPGELLRMYWYDAARDRVPTVEQRQIATLPHVKVRLGNLNSAGQQKGVDAQLRQDLEELARHRAVTDVVLLAGDEDMVPAVEAAQAYGVRVHVWGIEPPYGGNQAERLVWEADTVGQLDVEFCRPFIQTEAGTEAAPASAPESAEAGEPAEDAAGSREAGKPRSPTPAQVFAARKLAAPPVKPPPAHDRPGPERPEMEHIGARIAARWLLTRGRENVADLLPGPVLPTVIDKELLVEAEEEISRSLRPYEEARRALRDGFWAKLHHEFGIVAGAPSDGAGGSAPSPGPAHAGAAAGSTAPAHAGAPAGSPGPAHAGAAALSTAPAQAGAAAVPTHGAPAHSAAAQGTAAQNVASHGAPPESLAPDGGPSAPSQSHTGPTPDAAGQRIPDAPSHGAPGVSAAAGSGAPAAAPENTPAPA
jgi:uncharacterized LabA/DUF88 family protein